MKRIPLAIDAISDRIRELTLPFVQSKCGKFFLSLVVLGPLTFIPAIHTAWTAPNIDILKDATYPLMTLINTSALLSVIHDGNWRLRLTMVAWVLASAAISVAIFVR